MITAIIFGVLGFVVGWFRAKKLKRPGHNESDIVLRVTRVTMISVLTIVGIILGAVVAGVLGANLSERVLAGEKPLVSLEDNFVFKDDYLGTYIVYTREKALVNAYLLYQGKTILYETDGNGGLLKIYTTRLLPGAWYAPFVFKIKPLEYEISVPRGSILEIKRP